jgi:hypothetical protein
MSPNCWQSIEDAVRSRPGCRYLEWGAGNSTIALLRLRLEQRAASPATIHSVESDPAFAATMFDAVADVFRRTSTEGAVRVEPLRYPRPALRHALVRDPTVTRYEAHFLRLLWRTRNERFWVHTARPEAGHREPWCGVGRSLTALRSSAAFRLERIQRAVASPERATPGQAGGTVQSPTIPRVRTPYRVTFDSAPVRLEFLVVPQLHNRLWSGGPILDGLYVQFAEYVSAPLPGQFDVILVDGRARTSCLKRSHHDGLLAPGGVLFLHDAHRPSLQEALELFRPWSFVRGAPRDSTSANYPPEPPLVRSGTSSAQLETVLDRELYFYEAPNTGPPRLW